ncbi:MAG: peptide-methionine (S)-S-oxide reductase MsrA [Hyphomonadaceae bacterium]
MRLFSATTFAVSTCLAAATVAFMSSAGAEDKPIEFAPTETAEAIFAGGCFWCVESDFDKVDGVLETISGYTGGTLDNPTYKQVSYEDTGHYEAVKIVYDPATVSYNELLDYFWRHVDPTDADGQFCDRGESYRTAIFVGSENERVQAAASKATLDGSGVLEAPVVTPVITASEFYAAEDYHQDYYTKNPIRYRYYRNACGRDRTIRRVWAGENAEG